MSQDRRHVIRRECIDLAVEGSESEGFALQGRVAALCQGALATALDEAFERAAPGDEHWQFERIEVDAGSFTPESFERDFVAAVVAAVEQQVRVRKEQAVVRPAVAADEGDVRRTGAQSMEAAFFYFLATGALPWWYKLPEGRTLEALVSEAWDGHALRETEAHGQGQGGAPSIGLPMRTALLRVLGSPVARLRLARQFSRGFLERVLEQLVPSAPALLREVVAAVRRAISIAVPDIIPEHAWAAAFACVAAQRAITPRHLLEAWAALAPELVTPAVIESVSGSPAVHGGTATPAQHGGNTTVSGRPGMTSNNASNHLDSHRAIEAPPTSSSAITPHGAAAATRPIDLHEGVFVDCAGVVLLHPFLPQLFKRLDIAVDDRIVQPDRALALLHFLATGQAQAPEHALVLPKLLCGLEPSVLAGAPVELSDVEQKEAEGLLQAAIEYWTALGETSLDGFRGNFLVRPGKLSKRGDDDLLQVEKQSWDILLGQLPWGIGAVRLPWMPRMLWVEWPY